ncbi:MAG: hypothetical protein KC620_19230, partial [Myxococcales bacterium]|nr:hypothetical protein [Myxococcales bacterium]
ETAAALGHAVHEGEWLKACAAQHLIVPAGLLGRLLDAGLAATGRVGWGFAHGFLRDALVDDARAAGRWVEINRACAGAVTARVGNGSCPVERAATHLIEAGELAAAVDTLLLVIGARMAENNYRRALSLAALRSDLLDRIGAPAEDVRRYRQLPMEVDALRFLGRFAESDALLAHLSAYPGVPGRTRLLADAARLRGARNLMLGDPGRTWREYEDAAALYVQLGDKQGEAKARHGMAWALVYLSRFERAHGEFLRSHAAAVAGEHDMDAGWALHGAAATLVFRRQEGAIPLLGQAVEHFERAASRSGLASALLFLGEAHRQRGERALAWDFTRRADALYKIAESNLRGIAIVQAICLHLDNDDEVAARAQLEEIDDATFDRLQRQFQPVVWITRAYFAAKAGAFDEMSAAFTQIEAAPLGGLVHPGLRERMDHLGAYLEATRREADAARLWRLGMQVWRFEPSISAEYEARLAVRMGASGVAHRA